MDVLWVKPGILKRYHTAQGMAYDGDRRNIRLMNQLGQPVWKPGSPAGYDDVNASWAGPDAIMRRVEAAERLAAKAGSTVDARTIAERLFPGMLSPATRQILKNAESPQQAIALLLVSPEAMRR